MLCGYVSQGSERHTHTHNALDYCNCQSLCVCLSLCVHVSVCEWHLFNMSPSLLKQRYSAEASVQHSHLRDSPPGRLPEQVGGHRQQQFRAHQCGRPRVWAAEEKHPDVNIPAAIRETVNRPPLLLCSRLCMWCVPSTSPVVTRSAGFSSDSQLGA